MKLKLYFFSLNSSGTNWLVVLVVVVVVVVVVDGVVGVVSVLILNERINGSSDCCGGGGSVLSFQLFSCSMLNEEELTKRDKGLVLTI